MLQEFKKFAVRGNIIDLAIGVIIGSAFSKIVSSLVNDVIMPFLGILTGRIDLTALKWVVTEGSENTNELAIRYGQFLQTMIDFLIVTFSIFLVVKFLNSLRKKEVYNLKKVEPSYQERLLKDIRDILKNKKDK
ncbi:large conductance mechanosensitive channel [Natranaerovirga pectinivora]|uniref:Large-conductance mechanosensitive channel n=1 Tax=Natranaerovirga pectinivora TaxID=682400 RepID=A0A4R3MRT3_9FIRM|nr:large-conductance mechanosensitive channel protein MscL [Natranaerovirga pectinivora]TCT15497.1 large conductance mechanosensitive channel [Natranaerovirga pectinivora]